MIKAIFLFDKQCIPIVSRFSDGVTSIDIMENVYKNIRLAEDTQFFEPIVSCHDYFICINKSEEVYVVLVIHGDGDGVYFLSLLEQFISIVKLYLGGELSDFKVKDNFSTIYRITDLFFDSDFPLLDDFNSMAQFVNIFDEEKSSSISIYPWRSSGLIFKKPLLHFFVTEYLDYCVGFNGKVENFQIRGVVDVLAEINGNPCCSFSWKNSPIFDDISFHRSVDYSNFMASRRVSFIPPQGKFTLAKYRLQTQFNSPIESKFSVMPSRTKMDVHVSLQTEKIVDNIGVSFAILGSTENSLVPKPGNVVFSQDNFFWNVGSLKPGKNADLSGSVTCADICRHTVFQLSFMMEGILSGCEISNINIEPMCSDLQYKYKYITQNGNFQYKIGYI